MLITIATYSFPYEADIAKPRLDSEGIPAFIADEYQAADIEQLRPLRLAV